jgi:hypothetical protein
MTASARRTPRRASRVATARRGGARRATAAVQCKSGEPGNVLRNVESHARRTSVLLTFTRGSRSASRWWGNGDGAESSGDRLGFCATAAKGGAARVLGEVGVRNRGKAAAFIGGEEAPGAWARGLAHASGKAGSGTGPAPVEVGDDGRGPPVSDRSKAAAGWAAAGPKTLAGLSCRGVRAAAERSLGCTARLC